MPPSTQTNFLTTKEASRISGYNSNYLGQLASEGKIIGKKVGRSWTIDGESLQAFVLTQEERKREIARGLAEERAKLYRGKGRRRAVRVRSLVPSRAVVVGVLTLVLLGASASMGASILRSLETDSLATSLAGAATAPTGKAYNPIEQVALFTYHSINLFWSPVGQLASLFLNRPLAQAPRAPPSDRAPPVINFSVPSHGAVSESVRTQIVTRELVSSGVSKEYLADYVSNYVTNSLSSINGILNKQIDRVGSSNPFHTDNLAITQSSFSGTHVSTEALSVSGGATVSGAFSAATSTITGGISITGTTTLASITGLIQCLHVDSNGQVSGTGADCGSGGGGGGVSTTSPNSWSQLQQFNGNASTTQLSVSGSVFLGTYGILDPTNATFRFSDTGGNARVSYASGQFTTYGGLGSETFHVDGSANAEIGTQLGGGGSLTVKGVIQSTTGTFRGDDQYHEIILHNGGNNSDYYEWGDTLAAGGGHRFYTGGPSFTLRAEIANDGTYLQGPVGIGTTNPTSALTLSSGDSGSSNNLHIQGAGAQGISIRTDDSTGNAQAGINYYTPSGTALTGMAAVAGRILNTSLPDEFIFNNRSGPIVFSADSAYNRKDVYIAQNGNVGIGTTSPFAKLSVGGNTYIGGDLTATGTVTFATNLNGPLQAINGVVSASSTISTFYGGTGLSTAPTYGQLLLGNSSGGYTLTSTSSLGIASAFTATYPIQYSGNVLSLAFGTTTANTWSAANNFTSTLALASSTPWGQLSVNPDGVLGPEFVIGSSSATHFVVTNGGKVGIGTTSPVALLSLSGLGPTNGINLGSVGGIDAESATTIGIVVAGSERWHFDTASFYTNTGSGPGLAGSTNVTILPRHNDATTGLAWDGTGILGLRAGNASADSVTINNGLVGVGTTSPYAQLAIHANNGGTATTLFAIASSTASATTTLLSLSNAGVLTLTGSQTISSTLAVTSTITGASGTFTTANSGAESNLLTLTNNSNGSANSAAALSFRTVNSSASQVNVARIGSAITTTTAGSERASLYFNTILDGTLGERARIDSTGNFGIGTTSPYAKLSIHASNGSTNTTLFVIASSTASATTTLFSISNIGFVGIATTSPGSLLSINGVANFHTATSTFYSTGGINLTNGGCFAINNTCVGGSSFTNTIANGGTATTTFYSGGVVFSDGTKLTQASGSGLGLFTWDNTNNGLGIGTSSPWAQLSLNPNNILGPSFVIGSSTLTQFVITNAGKVGIGTSTPNWLLSVSGTQGSRFKTTTNITSALAVENSVGTTTFQIDTLDNSDSVLSVASSTGATYFYVAAAGNVGVGTTTPGNLLAVNGGASIGSDYASLAPTNGLLVEGAVGIGTSSPASTRGLSVVGATYIEDGSANAFSVGATGTTSLAFNIDQSAGVGNGLAITTSAPGSGLTLNTLSGNTNEALLVQSKGTGNVTLNTLSTTGNVVLEVNTASNASRLTVTQVGYNLIHGTSVTAATPRFSYTSAADVTLTTGTEAPEVYWNLGTTRSHASGAIATQRDYRITGSTQTFTAGTTNANSTIASSSVLSIDGPPGQGNNVNYTNAIGLYIGAGGTYTSASTTNAIGLVVQAPTGAANNYAAQFLGGNVSIGTTTQAAGLLSIGMSSTTNALVIGAAGSSTPSFIVTSANQNGQVGIGTTSPWRTLSVNGTVAFSGVTNSNTGNFLCVSAGGEVTSGTTCTTSSERFKHDIASLGSGGLSEVLALRPVTFKFNAGYGDNGTTTQLGFIAEEAVKVDPRLVPLGADGKPAGFQYQSYTAVLTKAIQELYGRVELMSPDATSTDGIVPFSATTSSEELVTASSTAGTTTPWAGAFVTASDGLKSALASITDTVFHVLGKGVYAVTGVFDTIFARTLHTDEVCVGGTCLSEDQFRALVQQAGQGGGTASVGSAPSTGGTTTPPPTDVASSTPPAPTDTTTPPADSTPPAAVTTPPPDSSPPPDPSPPPAPDVSATP